MINTCYISVTTIRCAFNLPGQKASSSHIRLTKHIFLQSNTANLIIIIPRNFPDTFQKDCFITEDEILSSIDRSEKVGLGGFCECVKSCLLFEDVRTESGVGCEQEAASVRVCRL